jgi:hypothetical protein
LAGVVVSCVRRARSSQPIAHEISTSSDRCRRRRHIERCGGSLWFSGDTKTLDVLDLKAITS